MKHILLLSLLIAASTLCSQAQQTQTATGYTLPKGKKIYIPLELRNNDFTDKESQWSYYRMACTPNIVCFWEKGFGEDLSKAPDLEGHRMTVDLDNLLSRLEYCIADMFRGIRREENFPQAYMRMYNVDIKKMGDELLDCYSRLITFDFPDKRKESERYSCELLSQMADTLDGWKKPVK